MSNPTTDQPIPSDWEVRPFHPSDAPGITRCIQRIYGDTYTLHPELYQPDQIVTLNQNGQMISVVTVAGEEIIGHYAIERPRGGPIGEAGEAVVDPRYQHHHLMERMHEVVIAEARRAGLAGLLGNAVTNHPFTERMYTHFDAHPCAITLGLLPRTFHNIAQPLTQRMSCLVYFQYLQKPDKVRIHVPEHHQSMVQRIYDQFGITVEFAAPEPPTGEGHIVEEYNSELRYGIIHVDRVGVDTEEQLQQVLRRWSDDPKPEALCLECPLDQPSTSLLCEAAERLGFYFCGIGPYYADGTDVLRLQRLAVDLDTRQIQLEPPFSRELLDYMNRERARVGQAI